MNGKLIVFEGIEGSGKTTQIQHTSQWLRTQLGSSTPAILTTKEPGGTPLGQSLREILLGSSPDEQIAPTAELLLFASDRAQHVETFLKPHLQQGAIILCDRFTDSTIAYQGFGRGLNPDLIAQLNQIATGGLKSDLTLWFDLEVEKGLSRTQTRGTLDRMERADFTFHQRVKQGFDHLAKQADTCRIRIDANLSIEQVSTQIQTILSQYLQKWGYSNSI
ncbi:MAG: dTMP kinase [Cyanobacteria bacterium J06592_8]